MLDELEGSDGQEGLHHARGTVGVVEAVEDEKG